MSEEVATKVAYVSIGNTDNRLTQIDWNLFCRVTVESMSSWSVDIYGEWYSLPNHPYQNACFCFSFASVDENGLRETISRLRKRFRQDAIALVVVDSVEMVTS